jgi:hypothetical protein
MFTRCIGCLLLLLATLATRAWGEPLRKVLTNSAENVYVSEWVEDGRDATTGAAWWVKKEVLHGGKQEGVDVITVNNGKLRFTVIPTRGMSIYEVVAGDLRLGWQSPVKEIVHPRFINLESRGGLGWLEGFNEWMVRCGLEFAGHPGTDTFINNVGDEAKMDLTLHGKIGNIPASQVEVIVDDKPPYRIRIRGRVDERLFYGPQLELWTEVSTTPGSTSFQIHDEITNRAASKQEFEIIYHANHGPPLLEEDSQFLAPVQRVMPMNAHAAKSVDTYTEYAGPTPGFIEQVYCLYPLADGEGKTRLMLHNAAGDKAVSMTYAVAELPYLTLWKNTLTEKNGYVTGIEPGTCFPYNRSVERKSGRLPTLAPGQTRKFTIDVALHNDAESVRQVAGQIKAIQAGHQPQLDREAPKTD